MFRVVFVFFILFFVRAQLCIVSLLIPLRF